MAAAAVDTGYVAGYVSLPQSHIQSLIEAPSTDLVNTFLAALAVKAREHETLQSENLRLGVELENAVRGSEAKARALKANADKALQEVETLRQKLNEEEQNRRTIESQLHALQSSSSTSTEEVVGLQAQVARLEKSNRDSLALYESKSKAHDKLGEELNTQHEKIVALRKQVSALEEQSLASENTVSSLRFRESNLQQEISNLKRNNEYLDTELKTKTSEYSKYRKEKSAKISELQRANEEASSTIASLQRTEAALRKRISEVEQKADEAFAKVQRMQEEVNRMEESFRAELDNARRLADLHKQSAETNKRRVQELDNQLEQLKDDAAEEISVIQGELDAERVAKEAADKKIEELELRVESLEAHPTSGNGPSTPGPATPRAGVPAQFGSPGSVRSRGGLTVTQMYGELQNALKDLEKEKRRSERLGSALDELVKTLEKKEPEMQELQEEHAFVQAEAERLSDALGKLGKEKDTIRKESRKWEGQVRGLSQETEILRQQLRDLSVQLKMVLIQGQLRETGQHLSDDARLQLEQAAREGLDEATLSGMTDTAQFISQNLVPIRDIFDLQEQNQKLLNLVRNLGEKMEGEEARAKEQEQQNQARELEELRGKCERLQDEVKILVTNSQSFVKERDMFRRMLSHRGQLPPESDRQAMFADSINGAASPSLSNIGGEASDLSRQLTDLTKVLKEQQGQYDAFRKEVHTDQSSTKAQLEQLNKDRHELQNEKARLGSQLELAKERYDMLQQNFKYLQQEKEASQERQQELAESAAKQDIRTQQVAEELIETKELSESLRNENSNLKMEKELWKRVESRLNEDNQALVEEKSRLNKSIADIQNLSNERERSETELRRKLQTEKDALDTELRDTKRKLADEMEESKRASLRREYEQEQSRTRIDDLVKSLGHAKEELAAAKTARDQFQARVEELKIELRSAEERAEVLRPLPTPRPVVSASNNNDPHALTREQELGIELADLRKELDLAKGELDNARAQVEQYKAIAQSVEEEQQNLNETQEQYREEMDRAISERDSKVKDLQQRVEDISAELSETQGQLSELQAVANDSTSRLEQQKATFDAELARVKDESDRYQEAAKFHQDDLKAQAQIAQQAQQSYENELVKHAEAAKQLQDVRAKYNEIKLEVSQAKADAEAARVALSQNQDSWTDTKEQYEKELTEMRSRRSDVDQQNKLLHEQLENVGKQIAALQQKRTNGQGDDDLALSAPSDLQGLHDVIKFLRREKEIVDVQYELSSQEVGRLRQKLDHTQSQLDEVRLKLDQERQRQSDATQSSISHSKLVDTINELNVFRESSVTLRNEARQAQAKLAEKTKEVETLFAQLEPLQESVRTLEGEKETLQDEFNLLKEDRDRWQTRTQSILQKYDRIDPAELEALKQQITDLEQERDAAIAEKKALEERAEGFSAELEKVKQEQTAEFEDRRAKMVEQFKNRSRDQVAKIRGLEAEIKTLQEQLQSAQTELQSAISARDEAVVSAGDKQAQNTDEEMQEVPETGREEGQIDDARQDRVAELESQIQQHEATISQLQSEMESLREEATNAQNRVIELQGQLDAALQDDQGLEETEESQAGPQPSQEVQQHLDKLKEELLAAQAELETLRVAQAQAQTQTQSPPATSENTEVPGEATDGPKQVSDEEISQQVEAQVASLRADLDAAHQARLQEVDDKLKKRSDVMRQQLNTKLTEGRAAYHAEVEQQFEDLKAKLNEQHQAAISQLKSEHAKALESAKANAGAGNIDAAMASTEPSNEAAPTASDAKAASSGKLSLEEAQQMLRTEAHLIAILKRNIVAKVDETTKRLNEEHEKSLQALQAEHEKALADKAAAANTLKERAVLLEGKKYTAKISMFEGRLKTATLKLEIVQKAASDTPAKPIVEVWEMVTNFKPTPATPAKPAATAAVAAADSPTPATPQTQTQPQPQAQTAPATPANAAPEAPAAPEATNGDGAANEDAQQEAGAVQQQPPARPPSRQGQQGGSGIPAAGRGGHAGTGPAALRGLHQAARGGGRGAAQSAQSRLPQPGNGAPAQRGTAIPRGGGRGGLNPSAGTFQPGTQNAGNTNVAAGTKRARDESTGGERGGKRPRGGRGG